MKKRMVYLLAILFILITTILIAGVGVDKLRAWHNSGNISLGIDNTNQTIDAIMVSNFAFPGHTYMPLIITKDPGHDASQIWVSVKDGEMTLLQALSSANKLCPAATIRNYTSSPADKSKPYHNATDIQLISGKNLQESIDAGNLCYFWYTNASSCSVTCGGGKRTTYCSHNGVQVADNYCSGTKPSLSCNTQGCVWSAFATKGCGPDMQMNCDMTLPGKPCSPAGTTKVCFIPTGSRACYTRIMVSTCG